MTNPVHAHSDKIDISGEPFKQIIA